MSTSRARLGVWGVRRIRLEAWTHRQQCGHRDGVSVMGGDIGFDMGCIGCLGGMDGPNSMEAKGLKSFGKDFIKYLRSAVRVNAPLWMGLSFQRVLGKARRIETGEI